MVLPNSAAIGTVVAIAVYKFSDNLDEYERLYIGDTICSLRNPETNQYYGFATPPNWPPMWIRCRIEEENPGPWNASVLLNRLGYGRAWIHSQSLYPTHNWELAMFELYPG